MFVAVGASTRVCDGTPLCCCCNFECWCRFQQQRVHQCATVQLDFQLPIRFNLRYRTAAAGTGDASEGYERPIIVHRAMLGSVERMTAVLIEHYGGKWPFWLSPRQCIVVPITNKQNEYAHEVGKRIHDAGFFCDVEDSDITMQKKVRNSQLEQFNFILVVGAKEQEAGQVNIRLRNNEVRGTVSVDELIDTLRKHRDEYTQDI